MLMSVITGSGGGGGGGGQKVITVLFVRENIDNFGQPLKEYHQFSIHHSLL